MSHDKLFAMPFAELYPYLLAKLEKKGHTKAELDQILRWLTGYTQRKLTSILNKTDTDLRAFFANAPRLNPNRRLITGVICGERVEDIEDPAWQEVRYMDKLVDELARGKKMEKVLRSEAKP